MNNSNIKLELMQQLMLTESNELLLEVKKLLDDHSQSFQLTDKHKQILDERRRRHQSGESASLTWDEVVEKTRAAR